MKYKIETQLVGNGSYGIHHSDRDGMPVHVIGVFHVIRDGVGIGTYRTRWLALAAIRRDRTHARTAKRDSAWEISFHSDGSFTYGNAYTGEWHRRTNHISDELLALLPERDRRRIETDFPWAYTLRMS